MKPTVEDMREHIAGLAEQRGITVYWTHRNAWSVLDFDEIHIPNSSHLFLTPRRCRRVSYLTGACTGRSAGFSPLRTRST
jgi:hypothetical protein